MRPPLDQLRSFDKRPSTDKRQQLFVALACSVKASDPSAAQNIARELVSGADSRQSLWALLNAATRASCFAQTDQERQESQDVLEALLAASKPEREESVREIIESALLASAVYEQGLPALVSLLSFGPSVEKLNRSNILFDAISKLSDPLVLSALLDAGLDPNGGPDALPPLFAACAARREDLVAILLERGADPDIRTANGWLPEERSTGLPPSTCDLMVLAARESRVLALSTDPARALPKKRTL